MNLAPDILHAEQRIRPYVRETPLDDAPQLRRLGHAAVLLKLENLQHTGSFKLRGVMNRLLTLTPEQRARGIVTASSGNHGAAVAYALARLGLNGLIFTPTTAVPAKLQLIERYGGAIQQYGEDSVDTEVYARSYAEQHDMCYISPYNDWQVVCGQGSIAVELLRQGPAPDVLFASVGGGGLIAGLAGYLKVHAPGITVVGGLPEHSPVMAASVAAQRIVDTPILPTLSDGTAGGLEAGSITFDLCRRLVDQFVLVSEAEIAAAMRLIIETQHLLIEGAAGVAVAAYLKTQASFRGRRVAIVLCGANIGLGTLRQIL